MHKGRPQGAPGPEEQSGEGGDATRSIPGAPPAAAAPAGMGSEELSPSQPGRVRRFGCLLPCLAALQGHRWDRQSQFDGKATWCCTRGGSCQAWLSLPVPGALQGGDGITPAWHRGVPAQLLLPHTQGPRRAFKIPFITMEPSRLKSPAVGSGLVSSVAD